MLYGDLRTLHAQINTLEAQHRVLWRRQERGEHMTGLLAEVEREIDNLWERKRQLRTGVGTFAAVGIDPSRLHQSIALSMSRTRWAGVSSYRRI